MNNYDLLNFPLVGFVDTDKRIVEAEYKNLNQLFSGLGIEKPDDYLVDICVVNKTLEENRCEYYINVIISTDSYKVFAYKEFYEDYLNSDFLDYAIEVFMQDAKNFPLKRFMRLESGKNGLIIYNGSVLETTYHFYEVAVL